MPVKPLEYVDGKLKILDQTRLPREIKILELADYREVASAIRELKIRGAPAIGIAAAYGVALGTATIKAAGRDEFLKELRAIIEVFSATRPTAVNLFRALGRVRGAAVSCEKSQKMKEAILTEAKTIHAEEEIACHTISQTGQSLLKDGFTVLTHCNTGSLATASYGTALGMVRAAHEKGKKISVLATETRPLLQGARLTTWELKELGIPVTLITDSMAGYFLSRGKVNCVIVGADRVAGNGDVANKIGTYTLAVLARENSVPFYVAAPTSTLDQTIVSGEHIKIEERDPAEVTSFMGISIAPEGVAAANPAFDITPHYLVTALITENGIVSQPDEFKLRNLVVEVDGGGEPAM